MSLYGHWSTYISAVFRLGEVNEVVVVHVLSVEQVAVLSLAQVLWINAIGSQKLLICNAEGLTNGLSNQLSLTERKNKAYKKTFAFAAFHEVHGVTVQTLTSSDSKTWQIILYWRRSSRAGFVCCISAVSKLSCAL